MSCRVCCRSGMDGKDMGGREISVCFAKQGRKRPDDYHRGAPSLDQMATCLLVHVPMALGP